MNELTDSTTVGEILSSVTWGSTGENDDMEFHHTPLKDMSDRHIRMELARWEHKMTNFHKAAMYLELAIREKEHD